MKKVEGTDATMSTNHTFMLTLSNRCSNIQKQNVDQGFTSPIHILSIAKVPSRFMRKIVCRLRLSEVNRQ